jgi:hypothetical protein
MDAFKRHVNSRSYGLFNELLQIEIQRRWNLKPDIIKFDNIVDSIALDMAEKAAWDSCETNCQTFSRYVEAFKESVWKNDAIHNWINFLLDHYDAVPEDIRNYIDFENDKPSRDKKKWPIASTGIVWKVLGGIVVATISTLAASYIFHYLHP